MKDLWKDRYIMGFVDKGAAQRILMERPVGSFLLRFSDSELGGVTIAFKTQNSQNGKDLFRTIYHHAHYVPSREGQGFQGVLKEARRKIMDI